MILAIDPGLTGAIALLSDKNNVAEIWDMPVMTATHGKGNIVNPYKLASLLKDTGSEAVYIEQVAAMPGQGVSSMFKFGSSFGVLQGVVAALGYRTEFVRPQQWKKHFGLIGKDKDAARTLAIQKYPKRAEDLARKKDGGRGDAIMIAAYAYSLEAKE